MNKIWNLNVIGTQANSESYFESFCIENALQTGINHCPLVFAVQTGCSLSKAVENFLCAKGEYYFYIDVGALTTSGSVELQESFIDDLTAFLAENGIFIQRPNDFICDEKEIWKQFLHQCSKIDRAPNVYIILEHFSATNHLFNSFLLKLERFTGRWLHFILLMDRPISPEDKGAPLFQKATCITFDNFLLPLKVAKSCLSQVGNEVDEKDLSTIWLATAGWALPSDLLYHKAKHDPNILDDIRKSPLNSILYLPELYTFFQERLFEGMTSQEIEILLKSSVDNHLSDEACAYLDLAVSDDVSMVKIAQKCPYITYISVFEKTYFINPVVQSFLYHVAKQKFGNTVILDLHAKAASYYESKRDWKRVLSHNLLQGKIKEASYTFRFLAFEVISNHLSAGYKELVRRTQLSILESDPWVQFAYAITIKYQYPDISIQYFHKALHGFQEHHDVEGEILSFCQIVSLGFFSEEHKSITLNEEMLRHFHRESQCHMCDDVVLDTYRKIFLAYSYIQLNEKIEDAVIWLNEAAQAGIILQDSNLRLWVDFVRILYYANRSDAQRLKFYVTEALELAEEDHIQPELKMYLFQTVAFVFFIKCGLYQKARVYCEEARVIANNIGASCYIVYINLIYAYALDCLREFELAEQIMVEAERTARNILNVKNEHLWAYYMIGQAYHYYLTGNDWQAAFYAADNAISLSRRSKRNSYLARALLVMSSIQIKKGDLQTASTHVEECLSITTSEKYFFYHVSALYQQAILHQKSAEGILARKELKNALESARKAEIYHFNFTAPWDMAQEIEAVDFGVTSSPYVAELFARNTVMLSLKSGSNQDEKEKAYYFRLLGSFRCYYHKNDLTMLITQKSRHLLEILATSNEPIGIAKIVEELWPQQNQKQAMNSFYFTLHQIRKVLGNKDFIRYEQKRCWLDADYYSTDLQEFFILEKRGEDARNQGNLDTCVAFFERASNLYRGPFLEDECLEGALESEKYRIERKMYLFFLRYGFILLQSGNARKCVEVLQKVVENEFSQEEIYRMLMVAHYILGNRGNALKIYQELERNLIQEMDVTPHFITCQIYEAIKSGESSSVIVKHLEENFPEILNSL